MANVLVVDDDLVVLDVMTQVLESLGHKVWPVGNAKQALTLLAGPRIFDLAIIDLVLPRISGFGLIKRIRDKRPSLPIIVVSGYIGPQSTTARDVLDKLGVRHILRKPVDFFALDAAVKVELGGS